MLAGGRRRRRPRSGRHAGPRRGRARGASSITAGDPSRWHMECRNSNRRPRRAGRAGGIVADKEQFKGKFNAAKGKVREAFGRATGDEEQVARGQVEQMEGRAQSFVGKVKDKAKDVGDKASRTAEGVAGAVKDASRSETPER